MRVLIAEDETIIRLDLRALLEAKGFQVCGEARDGEEAVELARTLEPDAAILDVKMPRLDGIEAARRITAERPIPIVMLTAYSGQKLVSNAIEAGAFGYLAKPFREQDLLPAIQTAAARHAELLGARRELGRKPAVNRLDIVMPSPAGTEWPLRFERSESGSLSVSVVPPEERDR